MNVSYWQWFFYVAFAATGFCLAALLIGRSKLLNVRFMGGPFLLILALTYLVRPPVTYLIGAGYDYAEMHNIPIERLPLVGFLVAIAAVSFAFGYRIFSPANYLNASSWRRSSAGVIRVAAVALIIVGYAARFVSPGENTETLSGGTINLSGTSFISLTQLFVPAGVVLLYAAGGKWLWPIILSAPFVVLAVLTAYNRYMFLTFMIAMGIVAIIARPKLSLGHHVPVLMGCLVVTGLFFVVGANRSEFAVDRDLKASTKVLREGGVLSIIGDFAGFEGSMYTVSQMDMESQTWGARSVYYLFILPIPRFIWPNKPLPPEFTWEYVITGDVETGYQGAEFMLFMNSQVRGHLGDSILEWGWAGPFVTFFLTGLFYGWLEKKFWSSNGNSCAVAAYSVFFSLLLYSGRESLVQNLIRFVIYFFVPYYLVWKFQLAFDRRSKAPTALPPGVRSAS